MEEKFWLVWCPTGPTPPRYRHETWNSAAREADRLAHENPNHRFFVVEALEFFEVSSVRRVVLEETIAQKALRLCHHQPPHI